MSAEPLLPGLTAGGGASAGAEPAVRVAEQTLSWEELRRASAATAHGLLESGLAAGEHVALWGQPSVETIAAVAAAVRAGVTLVPVNPRAGRVELMHVLDDSRPRAILAPSSATLPAELAAVPRVESSTDRGAEWTDPSLDPAAPAIIFYTSGTTDTPKGVPVSRAGIAANLDALAEVWEWTAADTVAHALPLFHVHGLVLGVLGPLRLGGRLHHVQRFAPEAIGDALRCGATMVFGVPTMYHRLAEAAEADADLARALTGARLLVSGSAALPSSLHERIERVCGQRAVERYGMTETLMITAIAAAGERTAGSVGAPLPGVEVRLIDDDGEDVAVGDDVTIGEVAVRGPSVFGGYLNRPEATGEALRDGWFHTGDLATRGPGGYLRIVGRRSTDIIKSGGYKIGALEIESALLSHDAVAEAAVAGVVDEDLGERVAAWVVLRAGQRTTAADLDEFLRGQLSSHKRPREIHFVERLPRNPMGKILKRELVAPS